MRRVLVLHDGSGSGASALAKLGQFVNFPRHSGARQKENEVAKAKKSGKKAERYALICNKGYGIYVGIVESFDAKNGIVEARECRHVARWFGRTGGITSLAAFGLCGPKAAESRIGAPVRATLTGIVNVIDCSTEARTTFESAIQS